MIYKLGKNIEVGNKIMLKNGWYKITQKFDDMVVVDDGTEIFYGDVIYGWKIK